MIEKVLKKRNSSIELLKIFAIIMIVFSHAMAAWPAGDEYPYTVIQQGGQYIDIWSATDNIQIIVIMIMKYLGQLGNVIFVSCSAWFLVESKKLKIERIVNLILDNFFISVLFLVVFLFCGIKVHKILLIHSLLPFLFETNWFITCYVFLYALHPILNIIINSLEEAKYKQYLFVSICMYSFIALVLPGKLYSNDLVGFILIYFVVGYLRKYKNDFVNNKELHVKIIAFTSILSIILFLGFDILGLRFSLLRNQMMRFCIFTNPLLIIIGISLLCYFQTKELKSPVINYMSSLSIYVYLIHCNDLVVKYLRYMYFDFIHMKYGMRLELLFVIVYGIATLATSFLLGGGSVHTIARVTKSVSVRITQCLCKLPFFYKGELPHKLNYF